MSDAMDYCNMDALIGRYLSAVSTLLALIPSEPLGSVTSRMVMCSKSTHASPITLLGPKIYSKINTFSPASL